MNKKYLLIYFLCLTIPLFLGLLVWQSNRYLDLNNDIIRLEQTQKEWIESNKKLVASIAENSSAERIDNIAKNELLLQKAAPEYFLQVKIVGGMGHEY
ncbi:MAG: cell division protein FtsL [Treponema sp.]|nr:cell division protein FtsL [Treponema sp.]MCL2250987.1 cell division protein FtsL [Treponema sp.]